MPHFRVDDALHSHPKAQRAGDDAMGMWVRAGSFCMAYLTDGFVPEWWVKQQPNGTRKAKKLVTSGLWVDGAIRDGERGYQFHEFTGPGRQDSREQIEADREKWRKKKADQRAMSPGDTKGDRVRVSRGDTTGESPGESPYARATPARANTNPTQQNTGPVVDDSYVSNAHETEPPDDPWPTTEPVDTNTPPDHIDNASRPTKRTPTGASRMVIRQELGAIGNPYPRTTHDRLALQIENLRREGHPDTLLRESLRAWDQREDALPEWLPTILGDLVKAQRAQPGNNGRPVHKMRATANLAQEIRQAETQAAALTNTTRELA